jgi:hypothetical protein
MNVLRLSGLDGRAILWIVFPAGISWPLTRVISARPGRPVCVQCSVKTKKNLHYNCDIYSRNNHNCNCLYLANFTLKSCGKTHILISSLNDIFNQYLVYHSWHWSSYYICVLNEPWMIVYLCFVHTINEHPSWTLSLKYFLYMTPAATCLTVTQSVIHRNILYSLIKYYREMCLTPYWRNVHCYYRTPLLPWDLYL